MRPENSQQHFYLPPAVDSPGQPAVHHHAPAVPPIIVRSQSRSERLLQQVTYVLVSLAAFVYVCQTVFGGLASLTRPRDPAAQHESAQEEETKRAEATAPKTLTPRPVPPTPNHP